MATTDVFFVIKSMSRCYSMYYLNWTCFPTETSNLWPVRFLASDSHLGFCRLTIKLKCSRHTSVKNLYARVSKGVLVEVFLRQLEVFVLIHLYIWLGNSYAYTYTIVFASFFLFLLFNKIIFTSKQAYNYSYFPVFLRLSSWRTGKYQKITSGRLHISC